MTVKEYIMDGVKKGTMHMSLIDPDKQTADKAAEIALKCKEAGTDAIMIGGSTGITSENLDETALAIKKATGLPVIYFPAGPHALSKEVDAMYYMSLVNSRDINMVIRAQAYASLIVKQMGVEPISMGYIIVEPGMKVGEIGQADLVGRDEIKKAMGYALGCEYMGMSLVYLEAGSGADKPVPAEMIGSVKKIVSIPLIVGGGIRTPEDAATARMAGADIVVTGTLLEQCEDEGLLKSIVDAAKGL